MVPVTGHPDDETLPTRLRRMVAELGCSGAEVGALVVLVAGAVAALAMLWFLASPGPQPAGVGVQGGGAPAPGGLELADDELVVHVAGEVAAPGLYRLAGGARVADAVEAAGGPLPDALLEALNLARPLADGEQLFLPGPGPGAGEAGAGDPVAGPPAASAWRPDGLLDLNRATAADLEELPGIGPVLAERIHAHRETVGGFRAVGDLREVPGIGEKKFQALAELVAV